nr:unnamed protein product [Callosobruchus analis]
MKINYKVLTEYALVLVVIFSRKRIEEVQFLTMAAYEDCDISINQEECLNSLTETEKCLSATFKCVVKNYYTCPTVKHIYFANPNSNDRWMSGPAVLRKYAHKCGAKNLELLTSTKFRKQLATILQLMNFEFDEMKQIARFMGHTEKTHKEFYRLTENVYQTAKVAKVLLLLNNGKVSEFKGKSLAEIEVRDDPIEEENVKLNITEETCEREALEDSESRNDNYNNDAANNEIHVEETGHNDKKGYNRKSWEAGEKQLVLKHFKKHVQNKIAPKKQECIDFINKNPYHGKWEYESNESIYSDLFSDPSSDEYQPNGKNGTESDHDSDVEERTRKPQRRTKKQKKTKTQHLR